MAKTVYIAGLGLIGASMALGIKRDHPDYEILGYNRSQASRDIAHLVDWDNLVFQAKLTNLVCSRFP